MRNITGILLKFTAVAFSTVPPVIASLSFFPLWRTNGISAVASGFTLLLLLFSLSPLLKLFTRLLKSPTSRTLWLVLFVTFFLLSKIADEMVIISLVGYIGNLIASLLWQISGRMKNE